MRWLVVLVVLLGMALAGSVPQPVLDAGKSFVHVWEKMPWGQYARICSGFATAVRIVHTSGHCIKRDGIYAISTTDQPNVLMPVRVLGSQFMWPRVDWATLTPVNTEMSLPYVYRCTFLPSPGEFVYAYAGPQGMQPLWFGGLYAGTVRFVDHIGIQAARGGIHIVSIAIDRGASGSPVFRSSGCVWGIIGGLWGHKPGFGMESALVFMLP